MHAQPWEENEHFRVRHGPDSFRYFRYHVKKGPDVVAWHPRAVFERVLGSHQARKQTPDRTGGFSFRVMFETVP